MSEEIKAQAEIKKNWDKAEIIAVMAWYERAKGFEQIYREVK